jgi:Ca2+-binding RTX toxin-like protein
MEIITGSGDDIVIRPVLVNGLVVRSNDTIRTNAGNDTINPGLGREYVYGGDGIDHLILDYSFGDTGTGMIFNSSSASRNVSSTNITRLDSILFFSIERFTVTGTSKDDIFTLYTTNSVIRAGAGNDKVTVAPQAIAGNVGTLDGGAGLDYLQLNLSNQTANLNFTNLLNINVSGVISATNFEQFDLTTGSGNDTVIQAGIVNGALLRANDTIKTGAGNDTINAGLGSDTVFGGDGIDHLIVNYSVGDTGTGMTFNGSSLYGTASRNISSTNSAFLDRIEFTGIDRFTVIGTTKNDVITGAAGNDVINAGAGNDTITGRAGGDILTGGIGVNTFKYQSLTDSLLSNYDVIKDLVIGLDVIDGPRAVAASQIKKLGSVTALTETAIKQVLTSTNFAANGASTFRFDNRTFLGLNNGAAGFSASTDSIIEITGFGGILNDLVIV